MTSRNQQFRLLSSSQSDPSSTNLCKVFVTFLYSGIADSDVLKEYYSKFGKITSIKKCDSTTFIIEFEREENLTTCESAPKVVIINRSKHYIATTEFINHDFSPENYINDENSKDSLIKAASLSNGYPQTKMNNTADATLAKLSKQSANSSVQSLKCENTTDNTSSRVPFATEAHQELCCSKTPPNKLVYIILEIASDDHLTIKEGLKKMEQYKNDFTSIQHEQLLLSRIEILSQIIDLFEAEIHFDVLLIKPSEAISVNVTRRSNYILLDSHKMTCTKGSYMIKILTMRDSKQQSEQVWPRTSIVDSDVDRSLQLEMLNTVDVFTVKLEPSISLELLPSVNTTTLSEEKNQPNESKNDVNYPTGLIQSAKSQYTQGNVSGCVIYATEACLRLLKGEMPSVGVIDEIISSFKNDFDVQHLTIEEVLADVERFSKGLEHRDMRQIILSNLESELERIIRDHINRGPFGLLLVKPPEAVSLIVMSQHAFIMFDSHKRSNTIGAYFDIEKDVRQMTRKMKKIWPVTQAFLNMVVENNEQYQLDLLNMCEVHMVVLSQTTALPALDISRVEKKRLIKETIEQKKEIDVLRHEVHDLKSIIDVISNEKPTVDKSSSSIVGRVWSPIWKRSKNNELLASYCMLCHGNFPASQFFSIGQCHHEVCMDCMRTYLMRHARHPFKCPIVRCTVTISNSRARSVLNSSELKAKQNHKFNNDQSGECRHTLNRMTLMFHIQHLTGVDNDQSYITPSLAKEILDFVHLIGFRRPISAETADKIAGDWFKGSTSYASAVAYDQKKKSADEIIELIAKDPYFKEVLTDH